MTPEKHPLEIVREALKRSREMEYNPFEPDNQSAHYNKLKEVLTTLNHYLCQKQSCAECERLGMENRALAKFILQHEEEKFYGDWACRQCYPHSEHLREGFVCAYHMAATIAAAGGD